MKVLSTSLNLKQNEGFYKVTNGIDVDRLLYQEEVQVQSAWVKALVEVNVLDTEEGKQVCRALESVASDIAENTFPWRYEDEDIHMNIERAVTEVLGDLGKKMHLGRSRNDLIATTMKLYLANSSVDIAKKIQKFVHVFLRHAERDMDTIIPAYTHYQAAQPIRLSHLWNFHALNFASDLERLFACKETLMKVMPLGSAAISGTHLDVNLNQLACSLGFENPPINSIHGVSDRDGLIDIANALSIVALHVIRFCDDVIFWSSSPVGILALDSEWSSGSSMMPNKRNPDSFEIIRAKFKKISSLGSEMINLSSGFISGYASDLHEQKRVIVTSIRDIQEILLILPEALESLTAKPSNANEQLCKGHILATDLANELVDSGTAFRMAYSQIAENVALAEKNGEQIGLERFTFIEAVEKRKNLGGTSKERVMETIVLIRKKL